MFTIVFLHLLNSDSTLAYERFSRQIRFYLSTLILFALLDDLIVLRQIEYASASKQRILTTCSSLT